MVSFLLTFMSYLCFVSCNDDVDFSADGYLFKSNTTTVYNHPNGKAIGEYEIDKKCPYIEVADSFVVDGWIQTSLTGFDGDVYLKVSDLHKMTASERYRNVKGIPSLLTLKWWNQLTEDLDLPSLGLWVLWATLVLGVILVFCYLRGVSFSTIALLLLGVNMCELLYFLTYDGDRIWYFADNSHILIVLSMFVSIILLIIFQIRALELFLKVSSRVVPVNSFFMTILVVVCLFLLGLMCDSMIKMPSEFAAKWFWGFLIIVGVLYGLYSKSIVEGIASAVLYITTYLSIFVVLSYNLSTFIFIVILYNLIKNSPKIAYSMLNSFANSTGGGNGELVTLYVHGFGRAKGYITSGGTAFDFSGGTGVAYDVGGLWVMADGFDGREETIRKWNDGSHPARL